MNRFFQKTIFLLFSVCTLSSPAQQLLNLDFEKTSIEGINRPWGWGIDSYTNTKINLDSTVKHHGKYSLKMNAETAQQDQETVLGFGVEVFQLKNKKITVEGWIKTSDLEGAAYFSAGYSDTADTIKKSVEISNTTDWHFVSLTMQVPNAAKQFYISMQHKGKGTAWFDDFSLLINGKKAEQVEVSSPFTKPQISWLENASHPLNKVDASKPGDNTAYDDLAPFKEMVKDAQIIALGEATHGTSEFFRFKHRMLQYCVQELGVRIFAIEDNQLIIQRANQYVVGGPGDARSSMQGMFSVWQTEEVRDLIQWMRAYNDLHPDDKVEFVGFDVQNLSLPIDSLNAFVNRKAPDLSEKISNLLADLKQNGANSYSFSDTAKLRWFQNAETVLNLLSDRKTQWLSAAKNREDSMAVYWGIQYATLVKQYAENTYEGHTSLYRDVAMAENVSWILETHKSQSKMLIWAHNNHISRGDHPDNQINIYNGKSMGSHLSKKYGNKYKAFGLSTYQGEYWAQISYMNFKMMSCPLYNAPKGSLDEALHRISITKKSPALLLDLSNAKNQSWLTRPVPERFANHVNIEYGYWTQFSIPYQYDGIIFIDKTTAAKSYAK